MVRTLGLWHMLTQAFSRLRIAQIPRGCILVLAPFPATIRIFSISAVRHGFPRTNPRKVDELIPWDVNGPLAGPLVRYRGSPLVHHLSLSARCGKGKVVQCRPASGLARPIRAAWRALHGAIQGSQQRERPYFSVACS